MPEVWPNLPFGELYAEPSRNGLAVSKDKRGAGLPMVGMRELFAHDFISDQATELVPIPPDSSAKWLLQDGDLLFGRRSLTLEGAGKCSIVVTPPRSIVFESSLVRVRLDKQLVCSRFYFYLFKSRGGRSLIETIVEQVAVAGIRSSDLARLKVPVPPIREQRRIAGILGAFDDLINVNRNIRTTLDHKGVALVEDFVQREPHCEMVTLGAAASLIEAGRRPRGGVRGISEGVPSIGAESIDGLGVFDFSKTKFVPADFAAQMRSGVLESRDVLIYKDGGKPGDFRPHVGMYGDGFPFARMTINEHVYRVRAASPLTEPYLYFWLSTDTSMAAMRRLGTGVAIPGLNSTALRSIPVAIPPVDIQQRLFPALEAFAGEALAAAIEARRLAEARDELLPLLLSGQVRVEEVAA